MLPPVAERQQHAFDPDVCDLCACREWRSIGRIGTGRALRSDRTILPEDLEKRVCLGCGLARRGTTVDPEALERLYEEDYRGGAPRAHVFYTTAGPVPRSDAFADWFLAAAGDAFEGARRGLECGAGTAIPTVRHFCEGTAAVQGAALIRINPRESRVPPGHVGLALGAFEGLRAIDQ